MNTTADSQGRKRRRRSIMVKLSASEDLLREKSGIIETSVGSAQDDKEGNYDSHGDSVFDPCAEMMIHDYDDERTLEEEEALETNDDPQIELSDLQKEGDMPLNELLAMYGYGKNDSKDSSDSEDATSATQQENESDDIIYEKDPLQDDNEVATNTETPNNEDENQEIGDEDDDDVSIIAEEPSALRQLYPELPISRGGLPAAVSTTASSLNTVHAYPIGSSGGNGESSSRFLRSVSSRPQSEEEEDDGDYSPEEEDWKKTIMVGSDYQAKIPTGLCKYDDALPYENEDKILWNPELLSEQETISFLSCIGEPKENEIVRDDEQALYLLLQCGYNIDEALRRRRLNLVPQTETMGFWSEDECRNFETGMRLYGKDFYAIQKNKVLTRSVGELVQFYYLWKKTERHDVYAHKARLEKKRHALHPGITDFMDKFLDEQEVGSSPHHSVTCSADSGGLTKKPSELSAVDPLSDTVATSNISKNDTQIINNPACKESKDSSAIGYP